MTASCWLYPDVEAAERKRVRTTKIEMLKCLPATPNQWPNERWLAHALIVPLAGSVSMMLGCETGVRAACSPFIDVIIKSGRLLALLLEKIYVNVK